MSFKKTGDIKGNTESLIRNLKTINYPSQTSFKILTSGNPGIYLPIIHYSLFNYSPVVAKFLSDKHYDMFAKNDLDFINTAFHCLITLFNYKPELSTEQFFSNKFAEGKIILCKEIIDLVIQKNNQLISNNKKRKGNINKNLNNNNNNVSPKFHELRNSKNNNNYSKNNSSRKKNNTNNNSTSNNNSSFFENSNSKNNNNTNNISTNENQNLNQNQINNNDDYNNIILNNNNFNASLPMNSIPVPTPKPQYYLQKNINNIQSSVQSFKPIQNNNNISNGENNNNQLEVYDSSQEYPLSGQNNSSGNNSNNNSMDFNSVVKIITSLSESVSLMVNKIETFKGNIEDRLNKLEAEIVLIKNKQNYIESRLNNNININTNSESENNKRNINNNNDNMININKNINTYGEINNNPNIIRNTNNINNLIGKDSNQINNNIYIQDSSNDDNNNYLKNNPIFTSFSPQIRSNTVSNNENQSNLNNKVYYNSDPRIYGNDTRYNRPYQEEKKVYNVFNYNQENDNAINNINDKNKYADIDKLIENSEKNFFKTQKLLEDYEKK